jgi:sortase A
LKTIFTREGPFSQWETADYAVGFQRTSALPGKPGNTVMSGHNNINGEVFRYLSNVRAGDTITVFVGRSEFGYVVSQILLLHEGGISMQQQLSNAIWIAPTVDERLTLVSCWPYSSNTQRLIVIALPRSTSKTAKP